MRCSFTPNQRFLWNDEEWEVFFIKDQTATIRDCRYGRTKDIPLPQLHREWEEGNLRFPLPSRVALPNSSSEPCVADVSQLPDLVQEEAYIRHQVVEAMLNAKSRTYVGYAEVLRSLAESGVPVPPLRTAFRWRQQYLESQMDIRSLVRRNACRRDDDERQLLPRWDSRLREIALELFHRTVHKREKYTVVQMQRLIRERAVGINERLQYPADKISIPSVDAIERQLYRLKNALSQYDRDKATKGQKEADRNHAGVQMTIRPTRILQQAIIDNHKFDLIVADPDTGEPIGERPWLTYCLDWFSGYPLGYYLGFENPSTYSTMYCLRHAICSKEYVSESFPRVQSKWMAWGVPEQLYSDNGREFRNKSMLAAAKQLQFEILLSPPGKPWYRGAIERAFRSLIDTLVAGTPGRTFSNPTQRGDYDAKSAATITPQALVEMVHISLVDIFAQQFHEGVRGIPARMWSEQIEITPPTVPPSAEDLVVLLSATETRELHRAGIQFQNLRYSSPDLAQLRAQMGEVEVTLKYHHGDLGQIWVWHEKRQKWIEVPCVDRDYARGLTLYQHKVHVKLLNQQRKTVNPTNLATAQKSIEDIKDASAEEVRRIRRQVKFSKARYSTGGKDFRHLKRQGVDSAVPPEQGDPEARTQSAEVPEHFLDFDPAKIMAEWASRRKPTQ